jgi:hypothetical protein
MSIYDLATDSEPDSKSIKAAASAMQPLKGSENPVSKLLVKADTVILNHDPTGLVNDLSTDLDAWPGFFAAKFHGIID